jgi:FkbM family methyltransferase
MFRSKAMIEEIVRERFFGSRLFPTARTAYQFIFNREKFASRRRMLRFYSQFLNRGDLVFDVGANVGIYTEVFSELGARVIAIEPNPRCCRVLKELARRHPVHLHMCALADISSTMTLQVCENHLLSALAPSVHDVSERSPTHRIANWTAAIEVEVKTLDEIAKIHGVPDFVKIDAEGFDDRVLRGMSFRPRALSFEYYRHLPEVAMSAIGTLALQSDYEFNYVDSASMCLASQRWMSVSEIRDRLDALAHGSEEYGDVIARATVPRNGEIHSELRTSKRESDIKHRKCI